MRTARTWVANCLVLAASWTVGCNDAPLITERQPELVVASPVEDIDVHAVNTVFDFEIEVSAVFADAQILTVDVLNIDGTYFERAAIDTKGDTGDTGIGSTGTDNESIFVPKDETVGIPLRYHPLKEGYHRAVITLAYAGVDQAATMEVRARAVTPDALLWPWAIDFGVVEVGELGEDLVTVSNNSDLELVISDIAFSSASFESPLVFPITIQPLETTEVLVDFLPITDDPIDGTMILSVGSVLLPTVTLRGNDCENGAPAAYDIDGDGFTSCGGDCDDSNEHIAPGQEEVEDGVDEDCDDIIDEGTLGYDDDGDGWCDHPVGYKDGCVDKAVQPGDCNDGDGAVNPDVDEIFGNGVDDNCDGVVDYGTTDNDGDGYSVDGGDCDDYDDDMYPDAPELADEKDNNCDGVADEGTILFDDDGDGFCEHPLNCTDGSTPGDCNDDLFADGNDTYPGAVELADWRDNDCDDIVDEETDYYDDDSDGFTEFGGDCDDSNPNVNPAAIEIAGNGIDEDCNAEATD